MGQWANDLDDGSGYGSRQDVPWGRYALLPIIISVHSTSLAVELRCTCLLTQSRVPGNTTSHRQNNCSQNSRLGFRVSLVVVSEMPLSSTAYKPCGARCRMSAWRQYIGNTTLCTATFVAWWAVPARWRHHEGVQRNETTCTVIAAAKTGKLSTVQNIAHRSTCKYSICLLSDSDATTFVHRAPCCYRLSSGLSHWKGVVYNCENHVILYHIYIYIYIFNRGKASGMASAHGWASLTNDVIMTTAGFSRSRKYDDWRQAWVARATRARATV